MKSEPDKLGDILTNLSDLERCAVQGFSLPASKEIVSYIVNIGYETYEHPILYIILILKFREGIHKKRSKHFALFQMHPSQAQNVRFHKSILR